MLHVWLVEGTKLILNVEQILKVPILAKIYNEWHNDRDLMYKIFRFIDCYADEDGYIKRNGLTDMKAFKYALDVCQLPDTFRPSPDVIKAIDWLEDHNINFVGALFFENIEALSNARDLVTIMNKNLRNDLRKDSFTKKEIASMLGYIKEITNMANGIPKLIENLKSVEESYNKSKLNKTIVRGGKAMSSSMDPRNAIENGYFNDNDVID